MSRALPLALLVPFLFGVGPAPAESLEPQSLGEKIARLFAGEIRAADRRLAEIKRELELLPELYQGPRGSRFGFHSEPIRIQFEQQHVQIDLGDALPIDAVVLMPVVLPSLGSAGRGYGFPLRFKIEVSDTTNKDDFRLVIDQSNDDFENPGRYPVRFATPGVNGRYVRITSIKHARARDQDFIWALEEILVFSGQRNIAATKPRVASSHEELFPNWALGRVNDGISRLATPWDQEPSPTNGFLSAPSQSATEEKWIIIDFEDEYPIDEVRLVPTSSDDPEVVGGRGFPEHFVLELSNDPDFRTTVWRAGSPKHPLGFPWNSVFVRHCHGRSARYLRVQSHALFARGNRHSFALAEVQAYSRGENVALRKPVRVSDQTTRPTATRWAPEHVVDGYSSSHRILELPAYLEKIITRGELEKEHAALLVAREQKIDVVSAGITAGLSSLGGIALFGWIWMIVTGRAVRRRDADILREQIARDLHDDVGSNLAGIVLISEAASSTKDSSAEIQSDFREIKETAMQTSEAMKEIVWLIQVGKASTRDMWLKMRETVERIVGDLDVTLKSEPSEIGSRPIELEVRRHFLFAFKECLHNVRKHAQTTSVTILFTATSRKITFKVTDQGVGFDPGRIKRSGDGLENLRRRAKRVNGRCKIDSIPDHGTTVSFTAPLNPKK